MRARRAIRVVHAVGVAVLVTVLVSANGLYRFRPSYAQDIERVVVAHTGGQGVNLRADPSPTARAIRTVNDGVSLDIIGVDQQTDERTWRNVRDSDGTVGWIAADFLIASAAIPAPATQAPSQPVASEPTGAAPFVAAPVQTSPALPMGSVRCYDAFTRFRYVTDPQFTLAMAMRDIGVNPYSSNPFVAKALESSPKIVGGWIAVALFRERRGYPAPSLGQWFQDGYALSFTIAASDWDDMISWPADSCEGTFVHNSANRSIMQLVRSMVQTSRSSDFAPALVPYTPAEALDCSDPAQVVLTDFAWRADSQGYLYVSGRTYNSCKFTVRSTVRITIHDGTQNGGGQVIGSAKLAPGEVLPFTELKTDRVYRNVTGVEGGIRVTDCPERIC